MRRTLLIGLLLSVCLCAQRALVAADAESAFEPAALEFFETKVRPTLVARCGQCHGEKEKGGLRLDSRAAALKGGDTGPAIVPGNLKESLLVDAINYGDLYQMPPKSKLPAEEIAILTKWVEMGAPWSKEAAKGPDKGKVFDLAARKASHWCWQAPKAVAPPAVKDQAWPLSTSDRLVLAKLEEKGLHPAPAADKATLIRRATFDLIGLPPTPEEVAAFLADDSPKAFEKVVDRLLASPHFGERWGRHWLDLVRYAESRGHEFEPIIPNAYQYRDYVIRAFNADLPYDRLVTEHLAGDLLPEPRMHPEARFNESVLGTGFWFLGEEVHSPVDIRQDECDRMDNRIDVVGKTFLALTIGCARCHDHKFDAISQKDYYALQGFLISSSYRQARFETQEKEAEIAQALEASRDAARKELFGLYARAERPVLEKLADYLLAAREAAAHENPDLPAIAKTHNIDPQLLKAWTAELTTARGSAEHVLHPFAVLTASSSEEAAKQLAALADTGRKRLAAIPPAPPAESVVVDFAQPGTYLRDGFGFGSRARRPGDVVWSVDADRPIANLIDVGSACTDPAFVGVRFAPGTEADYGALGGWQRSGKTIRTPEFTFTGKSLRYLVRGSVRVYADINSHLVIGGPLHGSLVREYKGESGRWQWVEQHLPAYEGHRMHVEFTPLDGSEVAIAQVVIANSAPPAPSTLNTALWRMVSEPGHTSPAAIAQAYQQLFGSIASQMERDELAAGPDASGRAQLADWLIQKIDLFAAADAPARRELKTAAARRIAEQSQLTSTIPAESHTAPAILDGNAVDEVLLVRGSSKVPGAVVKRRCLEALVGDTPVQAEGSGRLELAKQIASPENPLTARVMVNRIWHHLFGKGIVPSVDNFGVLGQEPSNLPLLDQLALEYVQDGWS
ncbi:MAG TPA: DUF1549 domain-containing protein, partial [Planctomycetaceae bacterium]|nr:DUF1549 domain-containing protein [Planctomycetaceae bacterium]